MMGCPIGIDWKVEHGPGRVTLSHVRRYDECDGVPFLFPEVQATLSTEEYRSTVVNFAVQAKSLFTGTPKRIWDSFDEQEYEEFWQEYNALLRKFETAV